MDFNKVWANFQDAVMNHYMDFSGRVPRAQYWWFILVCIVVSIGVAIVDMIVATIIGRALLSVLVGLALLLPIGGMSARRVQDGGQNGQLVWVWVGAVALSDLLRLYHAMFPPTIQFNLNSSGLSYSGYGGYGMLDTLVGLVVLVSSLALLYFCIQPGQAGDNQYGPPPPVWTPNAS